VAAGDYPSLGLAAVGNILKQYRGYQHDPEKWKPVLGKDLAQTKGWTMIQFNLNRLWSSVLNQKFVAF
jgi:hypothetical protein